MGAIEGRTWLELLTPAECWALVAREPVGRVAVLVDGVPEIYPINVAVHEETVVFRTDPGSKLRGLVRFPTVRFEVDGLADGSGLGWSVMVKGHAAELTGAAELATARRLPLDLWAAGEKGHWIRIQPFEVSGRRIHRPRSGGR